MLRNACVFMSLAFLAFHGKPFTYHGQRLKDTKASISARLAAHLSGKLFIRYITTILT